jgi:hypothetical protein
VSRYPRRISAAACRSRSTYGLAAVAPDAQLITGQREGARLDLDLAFAVA